MWDRCYIHRQDASKNTCALKLGMPRRATDMQTCKMPTRVATVLILHAFRSKSKSDDHNWNFGRQNKELKKKERGHLVVVWTLILNMNF
jgi:hypothetical protein